MNIKLKTFRNRLFAKFDGMIVTNPVNVKYLTGLPEEGILVVGEKENIFITDSRYIESVNHKLTLDDEIIAYDSRDLSKYDYEGFFMLDENVGFEESYLTYEKYKKYLHTYQVNLVETENLLENQRIVKDEEEYEKIDDKEFVEIKKSNANAVKREAVRTIERIRATTNQRYTSSSNNSKKLNERTEESENTTGKKYIDKEGNEKYTKTVNQIHYYEVEIKEYFSKPYFFSI